MMVRISIFSCLLSRLLNPDHRQWKAHLQFAVEMDLHMINAILLKLHSAEDVDIRHMSFQGRKRELYFALRETLIVLAAEDQRLLQKVPSAAAPARPQIEFEETDGERQGWDNSEDANERLLPADFGAHVFTKYGGLEIWEDQPLGHAR